MTNNQTQSEYDNARSKGGYWRLSYQMLLVLFVATMVSAVAIGATVRWLEGSTLREELNARTTQVSTVIAAVMSDTVHMQDAEAAKAMLEQAVSVVPEIFAVDVFDAQGNNIAHWGVSDFVDPKEYLKFDHPIYFDGQPTGRLEVCWDLADANRHVEEHVLLAQLYVIGGAAGLSLIFFLSMRWLVAKPLREVHRRLIAAARERSYVHVDLPRYTARELVDVGDTAQKLGDLLTERKVFEQNMGAARQQLVDAIEGLADGFIIFDAEDRLVICNQKYREFYHESADLLVPGTRFEDIIRQGMQRGQVALVDADEIEAWVAQRLAQHRNPSGSVEQLHSNGRWIRIEERKTSDGGIVGIRVDITELKKRQQELADAKEAAEIASQAKSHFLAMMSHEIRTPINAVLGLFGVLEDTKLDGDQHKYVDTGRRSAEALLDLINDILDFSKMEAGKLEFEESPFAVGEIVTTVKDVLSARANEKGISVDVQIDPDMPRYFIGDAGRLRQVLLNLVGNAVKFTDEGSVTIRATSKVLDAGKMAKVCIEVIDTGIGISADHHDELFAEFKTLSPVYTQKFGGTGLGLAISKKLIDMVNGEIDFESQPGKGSRFWFSVSLPMVPEAEFIAYERGSVTLYDAKLPAISGRILVAEDNPANQIIVRVLLESAGHHVEMVGNGFEAVETLKQRNYDLVLMDIAMPEMGGIEATRIIRAFDSDRARVPIIAMTAHVMRGDRESLLSAGMDDYLPKPSTKPQLLAMVQTWLRAQAGGDAPCDIAENFDVAEYVADQQADDVVNFGVLEQMASDTDVAMMPELVGIFIDQARERFEAILEAAKAHDIVCVTDEAHALKSSAATFGVMRLRQLADELEAAGKAGDAEFISVNAGKIASEGDAAVKGLQAYLKTLDIAS